MALSRIRATVTVAAPVASVTVSASGRLGATAGVTQAAVTKVIPAANIKWINIVYEASVDYRGLNPVVREITVVADNVAKLFGKAYTEYQSAADELQPFVIDKGLTEDKTLTEIVVYEFSKSFAELVDATDDLFGQANLDDEQVMFLVKAPVPEHVASSDVDTIKFGKAANEQQSADDDDLTFDVNKGLADSPSVTEIIGYEYQKPLTESVDAGDEINGVVNSDDGQTFFLSTSRSDSFAVADSAVPNFGKNPADNLSATDALEPFVLGKGVQETPQADEQLAYAASKPLTDSASVAEQHGILTARSLSDAFNVQREGPNLIEDYVTLGYFTGQYVGNGGPSRVFSKPFGEAQTVTDVVAVATTFNREFDESNSAVDVKAAHLDKQAADAATTAETVVDEFGKARDDSVSTAETQTVDTTKQFSELLDATDDVFAEANTDDEQVMLFGTTKADHATTSETKAFDTSKALDDTGSTSEDLGVGTSKPLTDSFGTADSESTLVAKPASSDASTSDADTISVGKGLADVPSTSDLATRSVGAAREDSVGSSDVLDKLFSRVLTDSWTVSDSSIQVFGKAASDTATSSESKTFDISKAVTDVVDATDDFDGTATAEDDQIMRFVTTRSEIVATSDAAALLASKGLADSADTDDSGSLRMTDYCDVNYFTAAYVGTSLTF